MADHDRAPEEDAKADTSTGAAAAPSTEEVSAEALLLNAALALDALAKRGGAPADIAVANIVDALWLARRRDDVTVLAELARKAIGYLSTRTDAERWSAIARPPQAHADRGVAVAALLDEASRTISAASTPTVAAQRMAHCIATRFPNLCPHPPEARGAAILDAAKFEAIKSQIAQSYAQLVKEAEDRGRKFPDPERLVASTLRAFGVTSTDAWNWIRGASRGTPP